MLTIFTSTFCRPDYVELLAQALKATVREEYKFIVYVQPNGLTRSWKYVDDIIYQNQVGYMAWKEIDLPNSPSIILHDDCIPILPWDSKIFPLNYCSTFGRSVLHYFINNKNNKYNIPILKLLQIFKKKYCDYRWTEKLCIECVNSNAESLIDNTFIHLKNGTVGHPYCEANKFKQNLIEAICDMLDIPIPEPLSEKELSVHPGKAISARAKVPDYTQKPTSLTSNNRYLQSVNYGPGTTLKDILKEWIGIIASGGCKCTSIIIKMDKLGIEWCESEHGMNEILYIMKIEHSKLVASKMIKIQWDQEKAKKLIKLACYRSAKS